MNLEPQFHAEMLRIYDEASELGYRPTRFLRMVQNLGGLQAAKQLLGSDAPATGFERLWELGRVDLTVECLVLRDPWARLFTEEELKEAERRLV